MIKARKLTRAEANHRMKMLKVHRWVEDFKRSGGELWLDGEILCSYTPQGPNQEKTMRLIYKYTDDLIAVLKGQIYS